MHTRGKSKVFFGVFEIFFEERNRTDRTNGTGRMSVFLCSRATLWRAGVWTFLARCRRHPSVRSRGLRAATPPVARKKPFRSQRDRSPVHSSGHNILRSWLAPLAGCLSFWGFYPGVSLCSTPGCPGSDSFGITRKNVQTPAAPLCGALEKQDRRDGWFLGGGSWGNEGLWV